MIEPELRLIETSTHGRVLVRRGTRDAGVLVGFHGYAERAGHQFDRLAAIPGTEAWTLVSIQGLNRFYRGRSQDTIAGWMTREDRDVAIKDNIRYVDAALDGFDASPPRALVFTGFSQGVAMAFRAAVRGRRRPLGVVAVGADVPPELFEDPNPSFPRVLLVRGSRDDWYTQEKMDADRTALAGRGAAVHAEIVDAGHEWSAEVSRIAGRFIAELQKTS